MPQQFKFIEFYKIPVQLYCSGYNISYALKQSPHVSDFPLK